jgi:hypothetical protein
MAGSGRCAHRSGRPRTTVILPDAGWQASRKFGFREAGLDTAAVAGDATAGGRCPAGRSDARMGRKMDGRKMHRSFGRRRKFGPCDRPPSFCRFAGLSDRIARKRTGVFGMIGAETNPPIRNVDAPQIPSRRRDWSQITTRNAPSRAGTRWERHGIWFSICRVAQANAERMSASGPHTARLWTNRDRPRQPFGRSSPCGLGSKAGSPRKSSMVGARIDSFSKACWASRSPRYAHSVSLWRDEIASPKSSQMRDRRTLGLLPLSWTSFVGLSGHRIGTVYARFLRRSRSSSRS